MGFLSLVPLGIGICQSVGPTAEEDYLTGKGTDPVLELQKQIQAGAIKLVFEPKKGYLRSILAELKISPSSQILVFSKTSLQTPFISASTPRAIYFNDRTYVGWIPGAPYLEFASVDPKRGPRFYTLRNTEQRQPAFNYQKDECLQCHDSTMTSHVPGLTARSVFAGSDGQPRLASGTFVTSDKSPFSERWGGWYVTGSHGSMRHMGNEPARGDDTNATIDMERGANVTDLRPYFEAEPYLTPRSDIVALMVAEHQMSVQNLITKAGFLTRNAIRDESIFSPELVGTGKHSESTKSRIAHACEPLVEALLFVNEAPLTSPVVGSNSFATEYSATAPKDHLGRSLSQLDLRTRLLRFRVSPMIYSDSFKELTPEAKTQTLRRLVEILSDKDQSAIFQHISKDDREVGRQILSETLPEFKASILSK